MPLPDSHRFPAVAVLDGGGVKGAALVGALAAAESRGFEFKAYAGTSAGAIVAALSAAGYTPAELEDLMVRKMDFTDLLDDGGKRLDQLAALQPMISKYAREGIPKSWLKKISAGLEIQSKFKELDDLLSELASAQGVYSGDKFRAWLEERLLDKLELEHGETLNFETFTAHAPKMLKVVASNVTTLRAEIFEAEKRPLMNVVDAVRASMSYPFIFTPVGFGSERFVDGGLCSNLPVSAFDESMRGVSLGLAFDLVPVREEPTATKEKSLLGLAKDMVATSLEGSDELTRRAVFRSAAFSGITFRHIPVPVTREVHTLEFRVDSTKRDQMFHHAYRSTNEYISKYFDEFVKKGLLTHD